MLSRHSAFIMQCHAQTVLINVPPWSKNTMSVQVHDMHHSRGRRVLRTVTHAWHSAASAQSATHKHFQSILQQMAFIRMLRAWHVVTEQQVGCKGNVLAAWRQHTAGQHRKAALLKAVQAQRNHRWAHVIGYIAAQ